MAAVWIVKHWNSVKVPSGNNRPIASNSAHCIPPMVPPVAGVPFWQTVQKTVSSDDPAGADVVGAGTGAGVVGAAAGEAVVEGQPQTPDAWNCNRLHSWAV